VLLLIHFVADPPVCLPYFLLQHGYVWNFLRGDCLPVFIEIIGLNYCWKMILVQVSSVCSMHSERKLDITKNKTMLFSLLLIVCIELSIFPYEAFLF